MQKIRNILLQCLGLGILLENKNDLGWTKKYGKVFVKKVRWLFTASFVLPFLAAVPVYFMTKALDAAMVTLVSGLVLSGISVFLYRLCDDYISHIVADLSDLLDVLINLQEKNVFSENEDTLLSKLQNKVIKLVRILRRQNEMSVREKENIKSLVSDISHQLKTPLASLNVFIDLLYDDMVMEPEKRKQMLAESKNQLNRMEWMVLSMLKLARIEAGAIQFEKEPNNLKTLLLQAVEVVTYLTDGRGQNIAVDCLETITLVCDSGWLVEGIINLLKNASDYSPENSEIKIEVEKTPVFTRIYVKDNGMGIPEADLPNIFKRFYRVNKEVNPNSVGIGLSLTKSIVEGMGGKITVRSRLGEYTHFILTFVH